MMLSSVTNLRISQILFVFFLMGVDLSFGQSKEHILDSLKQELVMASSIDSAYLTGEIAKTYQIYGDVPNGLDYAQMAYFLAEKNGDTSLLAYVSNAMGTMYVTNNNLQEASTYLEKAKELYALLDDQLWGIKVLSNLALVNWKLNEFETAKGQFLELLDAIEKLEDPELKASISELKMVTFFNLGLMHYELKEHRQALPYIRQADEMLPQPQSRMDSLRKLQLSVRMAQCLLELQEVEQAEKYVERGKLLALREGHGEHVLRLKDVEKSITLLKGEWEEFLDLNRSYEELKKNYFSFEREKEILSLNKKFEVERKNQEEAMLRKEIEQQDMQRMLLVTAIVLLTAIAVILFFSLQSRRRANAALRMQAQALTQAKDEAERASTAKEQFLSMMSHEIRTPLNGVIGLTNILLLEQPTARQKESLDILKSSANHLLALVNDILDYNKIETNNLTIEQTSFNLRESVKLVCKSWLPMAREKKLDLTCEIQDEISEWVTGDPARLYQVLDNLLNNALKFTHQGEVRLEVKKGKKDHIRFEVIDTGIGIPEDKQELIFDRFTQSSQQTSREYGGTGLGLTICRQLVDLMGGELKLKSKEGKGSRFYFSLALKTADSPKITPVFSQINHDSDLEGLSILLVEDNPVNQLVATQFLQNWGAKVELAANGKIALEKAREGDFQLILMDIHMPVMDGLEATRQIRQAQDPKLKNIPIIALTASVVNKDKSWPAKNGFDGFVFKPFDPEELLIEVKKAYYQKELSAPDHLK